MSQSENPRTLAVAILVRNAADALGETIASIRTIADQVVVLDTGSTDDTKAIAEKEADLLLERPWNDDFSAARNHLLSKVDCPWVLWLDAGETLSAEDASSLCQFVEEEADSQNAYMMLVHVSAASETLAAEQVGRIRLLPNEPGLVFEGRVRESLLPSIDALGMNVEGLPWRISRGSREHHLDHLVRKARRNLALADLEIKEQGPTARMWNCIAEARQVVGDTQGASVAFKKAIDLSQPSSDDMLEAYYGMLTSLEGNDNKHQLQLTICLQALEVFPLDAQLLCAMGGYLQSQERIDLAARSYQTAYQYGQVSPEVWHLEGITDIAATSCSLAMQINGNPEEALRVLYDATGISPGSERLRRSLIDLLVQRGDRDSAAAQLEHLPISETERSLLHSAVRGGCLASQKNWLSSRSHLQTAYNAGCRDALCMRWLGVSLLAMGEEKQASEIFKEWSQLDPGNPEPHQLLLSIATDKVEPSPEKEKTSTEKSSHHLRFDQQSTPSMQHAPSLTPSETTHRL